MSTNGDRAEPARNDESDDLFKDPYVVPSAETASNLTAARYNGRADAIDRWLKDRIAKIPEKPDPSRGKAFTPAPEASEPQTSGDDQPSA